MAFLYCFFGGAGGIRTLDRALRPYNGLANRRLQPLGHSSVRADMPDEGASRKRQIQVTAGPFGGAAALAAARHANPARAERVCKASFDVLRSPAPCNRRARRDADSIMPSSGDTAARARFGHLQSGTPLSTACVRASVHDLIPRAPKFQIA